MVFTPVPSRRVITGRSWSLNVVIPWSGPKAWDAAERLRENPARVQSCGFWKVVKKCGDGATRVGPRLVWRGHSDAQPEPWQDARKKKSLRHETLIA